ncbi:MAG TPA: YggT family protein [Candidatus Limnocylindrales bacterium]
MDEYERSTTRETTVEPAVVTEETVVRRDPLDPVYTGVGDRVTTSERAYVARPSGAELARRIVGLLFGILQALLVLRIVLLLLVANRANEVVRLILSLTDPFVDPFRGMFRLDAITAQGTGSVLDVAAVVALIGWTLVEALCLAIVSIGSRRPSTYA